jgi:transposase
MATLSQDLRERIVAAYDGGDSTRQQIAERYNVSLGMVKNLVQQRRHTGDISARHRFSGAESKITAAHQHQLSRLVAEQPDMTLEELRDAVGVACTPQAIHHAFGRMGLSSQKQTLFRAELNRADIKADRARWVEVISRVAHRRLLFIDESGAEANMTRLYGRARRGTRVYDHVPHGRWESTTMMAAVGRNGPQPPCVVDGPMDGAVFAVWAGQVLAPTLEETDIVVMDNLSVHKNAAARAAIKAKGAQVWDLPEYSPDPSPIEKIGSTIKAYLRKVKARPSVAVHSNRPGHGDTFPQ